MKLCDIKIHGHFGDDAPCISRNGERVYFPHIQIGEQDECAKPKYYKSAGYDMLDKSRPDYITINESGPYVSASDGRLDIFDAMTDLLASAPAMLKLLHAFVYGPGDPDMLAGLARPLVDRLMAYDIEKRDEGPGSGWGPYFNADGTPYEEGS